MSRKPLTVYNRYTKAYETEQIAGEGLLRLTYGSSLGRGMTALVFSRPLLSRFFGWYMKRPSTARRIPEFVRNYRIDTTEFAKPVSGFDSFNDFFIRRLKPESRPVDPDPATLVFPADGRHMVWPCIGEEDWIFVKGQRWDLTELLGRDSALIQRFSGGSLLMSRLCPVDYHHFHYPCGGTVREGPKWIHGSLFSVNPLALRHHAAYLWRNKRCLSLLDGGPAGQVCMAEVGATNVGSILHEPVAMGEEVSKGAHKGWFEFGGSCVLTLFEPGRVRFDDDILEKSGEGIEIYARVGDRCGIIT